MVYLSKEMCQLLKAWRKECEWDRQQTANETLDEDDYLFRQPNGKPMNPCIVYLSLQADFESKTTCRWI